MATPSVQEMATWAQMRALGAGPKDNRISLLLAIEIPVVLVMLTAVTLRIYARSCVKKALGLDDLIMSLSAAFSTTKTILICVSTRYGTGLHAWAIDLDRVEVAAKIGWFYQVLFTPAVTLCKISICLTYLRVFPGRADRIFSWTIIVLLILAGTGITLAMIFICVPVHAYWDVSVPFQQKSCFDMKRGFMSTSALNTVTDLAVFLWPAPRLWTLKLPPRQRVGLILVFSLGCIACVAGIARLWYFTVYFSSTDVLFNVAVVFILSSIECNTAITCGSLPEIRPLLSRFFKTVITHSARTPPSPLIPAGSPGRSNGGFSDTSWPLKKERIEMQSFESSSHRLSRFDYIRSSTTTRKNSVMTDDPESLQFWNSVKYAGSNAELIGP